MEREIWKDVEGYEGLYQVSNYGRLKRLNYKNSGTDKIQQRIDYEMLFWKKENSLRV